MAVRLSRRKITEYIADSLVAGASEKDIVTSLAAYLIDSRRTSEIELIIRDLDYQLSVRGIVLANVSSAYTLSEETKKAIIAMLKDATGATSIELEEHVTPAVLGGVRIDIPGSQIDGTIARRLNLLTTNNTL
jgi:F0F1-type ATP synthase delta subunit